MTLPVTGVAMFLRRIRLMVIVCTRLRALTPRRILGLRRLPTTAEAPTEPVWARRRPRKGNEEIGGRTRGSLCRLR